ncbi:hypothetical protein SAMN04488005_0537 [Yoonia tamlensis]|uniref:DUF4136 domain-containing protein n=2 Tax=Yoonia tamlensis TaxID=390270 RepID=A0A1I6FV47_9RHOB|nr:hypothetical protein SAMN04488005_0537 [Yoonia tamlensis]
MRSIILLVASLAFQTPAFAEESELEQAILFGHDLGIAQISETTEFFFILSDNVSDGCWLTPERAISSAKREFLDAGYPNIVEEFPFGVIVRISANGYETSSNTCAVNVGLRIGIVDHDRRIFGHSEWHSFTEKNSFRLGSLLTGPKSDMSTRINEQLEGYVDEFIVEIQLSKNRLMEAIWENEASELGKSELLNAIPQ